MFHFLNLDAPYPPRSDFARYVNWVADQFKDQTHYSEAVSAISLCDDPAAPSGRRLVRVDTGSRSLWARSLSFAPGRSKNIPEIFQPLLGDNVFHFTEYTGRRDQWQAGNAPTSVAVIGSSQSSVEIILDLRGSLPGTKTHSVFRKFSYVLKDTSPFTEDLLFPKFTDYFYNSSPESKQQLTEQVLRSNYGSVDEDVLKELYFVLYENKVRGDTSIMVHNNRQVVAATRRGAGVELVLRDQHTGDVETILVDAVILATGFRNFGPAENEELCHPLLRDIADSYEKNEDGTLRVTRSYQAVPRDELRDPPLVLNGLCESSHGLGDAGSFSLLSFRAFDIERALAAQLSST